MSLRGAIVRLLDHPGGRFILAKAATASAQRITRSGVQIAYQNGQWLHHTGPSATESIGPNFAYTRDHFRAWRRQIEDYASETRDYWLRFYEPKQGDTIIDAGAGHGEDTLSFSRLVGPSGRVIAIEAHPLSFKALKNFCRLNRLDNVIPVHLALMDKPGEVRIIESESWMENRVTSNGEPASNLSAPAGTLDDLCRRLRIDSISFLKMNIEGAERYALLGAQKAMPHIQHICVACHDFRANQGHGEQFRTRSFTEQFLSHHGFASRRRADPRDYICDQIFGGRDD